MKARLLSLLLLAAPASADPGPHALQRHRRPAGAGTGQTAPQERAVPAGATGAIGKPRITTTSAREESPARRAKIDPEIASRVLRARIAHDHVVLQPSVVERPSTWVAPLKRESKPWRPKLMLYPMSSMASQTGGKGVKLKFRF